MSRCGLLFVTTCVLFACGGSPGASGDPQPPGSAEGGGTIGPAETYVKVKASKYGTAGGGVIVMIDVGGPNENAPYTNAGDIKVWVGVGDDTLQAPGTAPATEAQIQSLGFYDLNAPNSWGGGIVKDRTGRTKIWVFVEVRLERSDGSPPSKRWFNKVLGVNDIDLPSGWVDTTAL